MKTLNIKTKNKTAITLIAILLMISMGASTALSPNALAQVYPQPGTHVPSYAQINVAPNPIGIGQTVTVNMYLAVPLETSERVQNMTLLQVDPNGVKTTLGPFTSDATGGTYYAFAPDKLGNYTFQFVYPGQTLTGNTANTPAKGWGGLITDGSSSPVITLTVQQEPVSRSSYPITPLPTAWWQTPVTAENIQEWYKITGAWLGLSSNSFATTGSYNSSTYCNPYTESVLSGHVLWTLPWGPGGVPGGDLGGTESSNFWTTRQYQPNFSPVIMDGILYSTQYSQSMSTGSNNGLVALDLKTGEQLFNINTTNSLRCGMLMNHKNANEYGVVGPYVWTTGTLPASDTGGNFIAGAGQSSPYANTTGTQWNMYDGWTGRYVLSIVNGSSMTLSTDDQQGLMGYFLNNTAGSELVHPNGAANFVAINTGPHVDCFNFSKALGGGWSPARNSIITWQNGIQFAAPVATNISGAAINPALSINTVTEYSIALTGGFIHGQGVGGEQAGWLVLSGMDAIDGHQLMLKNVTRADTAVMEPYTRLTYNWGQGDAFIFDGFNWKGVAYDMRTGAKMWETQLTAPEGYQINPYDVFNFKSQYADGMVIVQGFGGDLWGVNATTGVQMWATNTLKMLGDPGVETPYGTWPLWVFSCQCQSADMEYCAVGHEYDPPMFHGAQVLALNLTNGNLVWKELGTYTRAMVIADGVLVSNNAYDNQIYAWGKGPSATTVTAPSIGVTTATPITITGTVTDISTGSKQSAVAANFPNGLPCVSDASQSHWMEYVYQQQLPPTNTTGVLVSIDVIDSNNNFRTISTTTSDASGTYGIIWTPDIPGNYTIIANFAGSNSYYPSSAETRIFASSPQATATATAQENIATSDIVNNLMVYLVVGVIAIIIAIAIVGLLILRKHP